jgi:hypothetical protein
MTKLRAFILGVVEFRSEFTTHFENYADLLAYDTGRELAHKLTFRSFEP